VQKLAGKPFALIGVSINPYGADRLKEVMERQRLNWRSFADGGAVTHRWNLHGTPTLYVIDAKGVIRHKWVGSPGAEAIDAALGKLIPEAERDGKGAPK
jgi:hypothetical protein